MLDISILALAFTAGAVTLLSPCGYALLPGYLAYHVGSHATFGKSALAGLTSAFGLVLLYGSVGVVATTAGGLIRPYVPGFTLLAAAIVSLMGITMLLNVSLPSLIPVSKFPSGRGFTGFFLYGVAYGFGGAGCTAPLFVALLTYAIASFELADGVFFFVLYALGIGLPLVVTSLLAGGARSKMLMRISRITPLLHRVSGLALLVVGAYLVYYYYRWYS